MHSAGTITRTKNRLSISDAEPKFGSTKLATAAIRGALALAVLSALLLIAARPAQAQTETVLYNFTGGSDGSNPYCRLTADGAGNFYDTTPYGGASGYGTVFELSPNGTGGWNETVLYNFTGGADGSNPWFSYLTFDSMGNLYGTAATGGANGYGVVFELSPVGTNWTETVLYSFANAGDGATPVNGLIMDPAGNLYGGTYYGGAGSGTVFEVSPNGGGGWTEQVIYDVGTGYVGLTMSGAGDIFVGAQSAVLELSPNGHSGWNATVIHTFAGGPKDGITNYSVPVLDKAGNLYGTTFEGGAKNFGTVYKLSPVLAGKKKGTYTEKILYSFKGGKKDGTGPQTGIVFDAAGNIYGTTYSGGKYNDGTVFELVAPVGTGKTYKEKVLWGFDGTDGANLDGSLILDNSGNLYGTAFNGGSREDGVVFEVTP
jgi:uncharacterized repeat protein (TIGR03803 family)